MPLFKKIKPTLSLKLIIGCGLTLLVVLFISFSVIAKRQERLIMGQVENEARAIFKQIVITRRWIADHGGIFVEKLPWVKPSPYLDSPEITDIHGKRYVRETPAMVTKELTKYAKDSELYWFHITSLKLTNPENTPDAFEKNALMQFEKTGAQEMMSIETINRSRYLRYISPLYVEDACLQCHTHQGYKRGDVRGAISVTIPIDKTLVEISANRKSMLVAALIAVLALGTALLFMMNRLVLAPMRKLKRSIKNFSNGAYSPEDRLQTGDEFEDVCRAFSEMANTVTEHQSGLNDKIQQATANLEETNKKLIEANTLLNDTSLKKSDFIARASHELRTPLTSIRGAMDYLSARLAILSAQKTDPTSLDDLRIFFELIKKNSERLIRMVTGMLDIERMELGVSEMRFVRVDLAALIQETVTALQLSADDKNVSFRTDCPEALFVQGDEDRLRQVLLNVVSNALKFSPEYAEIAVRAYRDNISLVTEVVDRGPGVPATEQEKIFEKFYKTGEKEGSGLGLAICKSIVEAHGGTVGVTSDGEQGSCFYFRLPCAGMSK